MHPTRVLLVSHYCGLFTDCPGRVMLRKWWKVKGFDCRAEGEVSYIVVPASVAHLLVTIHLLQLLLLLLSGGRGGMPSVSSPRRRGLWIRLRNGRRLLQPLTVASLLLLLAVLGISLVLRVDHLVGCGRRRPVRGVRRRRALIWLHNGLDSEPRWITSACGGSVHAG